MIYQAYSSNDNCYNLYCHACFYDLVRKGLDRVFVVMSENENLSAARLLILVAIPARSIIAKSTTFGKFIL